MKKFFFYFIHKFFFLNCEKLRETEIENLLIYETMHFSITKFVSFVNCFCQYFFFFQIFYRLIIRYFFV